MRKDVIGAIIGRDETKSPLVVEKLYGSTGHEIRPYQLKICASRARSLAVRSYTENLDKNGGIKDHNPAKSHAGNMAGLRFN